MKNLLTLIILLGALFISAPTSAQDAETVKLEQTPGKFTQEELKLEAGKQYVFEIANNGIDHPVGFVVAPKGRTQQEFHIQEAYVTTPVEIGKSSLTNTVTLEAGQYVYFCPLNPTPQYTLVVE